MELIEAIQHGQPFVVEIYANAADETPDMRVTCAEVFLYTGGVLWVDIGWPETPSHPFHRAAGADPKAVADGSWIASVSAPAPKGIVFPKIGLRANTPDDSHWGEYEGWLDYQQRMGRGANRANAWATAVRFFGDMADVKGIV